MPPFQFESNFIAGGSAAFTGPGQVAETWWNGRSWRWTATLGSYSGAHVPGYTTSADALPMRAHMMRNAIFWATRPTYSNMQIRTAAAQISGRPATCILISGMPVPSDTARLWEEEEYCVDDAAGVLLVHSIAPGTFVHYSYQANADFHRRRLPDHITIYVNGAIVLDGPIRFSDPDPLDPNQARPTAEIISDAAGAVEGPARIRMNMQGAAGAPMVKPVIVHASVNGFGAVVEAEISAASDVALAKQALDVVKQNRFPNTTGMRQMYVNVRFLPAAQ
jgi:hypothetical protein